MSTVEQVSEKPRFPMCSVAEVELCSCWMEKYGEDMGAWPLDVVKAYAKSVKELLAGGVQ